MDTNKQDNRKDLNIFLSLRNPGLNARIQDYWVRNNRDQRDQGNRMAQNKMEEN